LGTGFQTRAANPQQGKLNLNASEITYKEIFKEIQKQTGYVVMYNNADLNKNESIEVDFNNVDLDEALKEILDQKGLTFQVKEDLLFWRRIEVRRK
jgi:Secretin and TonB N terminus short domain.